MANPTAALPASQVPTSAQTVVSPSGERSVQQQVQLEINLPVTVYREIDQLAKDSDRTLIELVQDALALAYLQFEEENRGNRLAVVDRLGRTIKQVRSTSIARSRR